MKFMPPSLLPASLWQDGPDERSRELTPLYVDHYYGPFTKRFIAYHGCWEFVIVCAGSAQLLASPTIPLTPGTVCLLPPGTEHTEYGLQPIEVIWVGMRGTRLDAMSPHGIRHINAESVVRSAIPLWKAAQQTSGHVGTELDGLALILFNRFRRQLGEESIVNRLDQAISYLHAHFHEDIAIPELAVRYGYSTGYFYRAFRQLTGKTPVQYITALRVKEAWHWLRYSDQTIECIAERLGFATAQYFSAVFKHTTGHAPSAVRRQHLAPAEE